MEISRRVTSKEIAKGLSTAFITNISGLPTMVVNIGILFDHIKLGYPTFILNLVNNYIHEMLHAYSPAKTEQGVYDMECLLVEQFLEFKLPREFKSLKASNYYHENNPKYRA